jgi:membrane-associated phospholipid phosphatase
MKKQALLCFACCLCLCGFGQKDSLANDTAVRLSPLQNDAGRPPILDRSRQVYRLKPAVDIPVTAIGVGWSLYAFTKIYSKDSSTTAQILALNKNDLAGINRFGVKYYSPKALSNSNMFFYGSMPYPLVLMLDKHIRRDAGKIAVLWAEAMGVTGLLYTSSVYFHDKYRPYTYNPDVPMSKRTRGGGRNSFFAGHVALVGTSTFFTAKVFADYHPESNLKWLFYGIAGVSTAATGYLRFRAGEHFLTDILIGTGVGTLTGILVPQFHKNKMDKESRMSIVPYFSLDDQGVSVRYKL